MMKYLSGIFLTLFIITAPVLAQSGEASQVSVADFVAMAQLKTHIKEGKPEAVARYKAITVQADKAMRQGPFSVVNKTGMPPSGDKHDYMSLAPYFWPNPDTPDGLPYIRKDGEVNPETRNGYTDYAGMRACFKAISDLGRACYYTDKRKYAKKAVELIDTWFIKPETKMNPNINFGQGIPGEIPGRPYGIIEFNNLDEVIVILEILDRKEALPVKTKNGMREWLSQYAVWLQTSELGITESTRRNNHATWYDLQLSRILIYIGNLDQARNILEAVKQKRIATQIEPDGSQPFELVRTKSFSYSTANLAGFTELAMLGEKLGVDLWKFETEDGRSIQKAYDFLMPYITTDQPWPYKQLAQKGDYKEQFRKLVAQAGKYFNEDRFLEILENLTIAEP